MSAIDYESDLDIVADLSAFDEAERRRLLMIVNPYATTVSSRLKNLVISALRGSFIVDAVDTERRDHATEICREAADEGYDAIVAFGGDGTVNEAANGLAGTGTPLTCLPGGRANVYCRMLGIPADVVDATEHLLSLASDWRTRRGRPRLCRLALLPVLGRGRSRRKRRRARRRAPAAQGAARRVLLRLGRDDDLRAPLPVQATPARSRAREPERRTVHSRASRS